MARVALHNVTVTFPVISSGARSLRASLLNLSSAGVLARDARGIVTITALRDVRFEAKKGDRIALIGRNGSGKTTMLKVIAGIYPPSSGSVEVEGRISPVFGAGLGVDEDLPGYEAIEYALHLRGVPSAKISLLREEIANFTELRGYLSVPVRTYSAGMKMRLGFAVATADEPDVLLIDEGIMAGDVYFMAKARQRADRLLYSSNILFLASHDEQILTKICRKALLLDSGEVLAAGDVENVLKLYHRLEDPPRPNLRVSASVNFAQGNIDAADGGKPIASGNAPGHTIDHAFDGAIRTHWLSNPQLPVRDAAYAGYDLGEGLQAEVRGVKLRQWCADFQGSTCVTAIALQMSDDGFKDDVRIADVFELEPTIESQSFGVASTASARFWRILAKSAPLGAGAWGLAELDFDVVQPENWQRGGAIGSVPSAPNTPVEAAFDNDQLTFWATYEGRDEIQGSAWLGWDFGTGRKIEIRSFVLRQWDGGARPNTIPRVKVQSSNDGFVDDVETAGTVELRQDTERHNYGVTPSREARFWRILADSTTDGGHWGVSELSFSEQEGSSTEREGATSEAI